MFYLILFYLSQSFALNLYNWSNCTDQKSLIKFIQLNVDSKSYENDCKLQNINIENFKNLSEIKLNCVHMTNCDYTDMSFKFIPKHSLVLSNDLSFNFNNPEDLFWNYFSTFIFYNIRSIDKNLKIFDKFKNQPEIRIAYSKLKLSSNKCTLSQSFTLFRNCYSIRFEKVKYVSSICPLIFHNKSFTFIKFESISDTLIFNNKINFIDLNTSIETRIDQVFLRGHLISISNNSFNTNIFRRTNFLFILGKIKKFDWSVILQLNNLNMLTLSNNDLHTFLYNNYKWFEVLDKSRINKIEIWFINEDNYTFPNQDFCIFYKFSKFKLIKFEYNLISKICNCVTFWIAKGLCSESFSQNCSYEKMSNNCQNFQIHSALLGKDFTIPYKLDYLITGAILSYITSTGSLLFGTIAFVTNMISIFVIIRCKRLLKLDKNKHIQIKIYNLMILSSLINMIYCLIQLFHIMNSCALLNGLFCSNVSKNILAQYYEIYCVDFIAGFLKSLSNILNICISFARCFAISQNTRLFKIYLFCDMRTSKVFKKIFLVFLFALLIGTNIDKLNSSIVYDPDGSFDPDYFGIPMRNWMLRNDIEVIDGNFGLDNNLLKKNNYFFLFVLNVFFNGLILWVLLFASDIYLLYEFKNQLKKSGKFRIESSNQQSKKIYLLQMQRKINKASLKIWLNNFVIMILRLIELTFNFYIFYMAIKYNFCQESEKICDNYMEFGNLFFMITCSYLIFNYCLLNKSFRNQMKNILTFRQKFI
ncbi:unnamed protein product [Brachionus calyciflorus]|uniref:Uncharacterized protein n=1 Tax=Brachionus calyciflorus TaxID=104777 RepID=A0A813M2S4_9BILA|nr:unnamed protein product [Brachionus calyciflorus]